jgi:hypothetical protein
MLSAVDDHGFVTNDVPCEKNNEYVPDPHDCSVVYLCIKNAVMDRKIKVQPTIRPTIQEKDI